MILGKTVTTPYAWIDPPVTRNPWNLERTPGGSSSGSAAAVACGMCLGAIGTQTGGSITRPAAFCGIAGMKPTYGRVSLDGVLPLAPSLDHVGALARTVEDLRHMITAMGDRPHGRLASLAGRAGADRRLRLGQLQGFFDRRAEPAVKTVFDAAIRVLEGHGTEIIPLDDPVDFELILVDHRRVVAPEAALVHSDRMNDEPDEYPPRIRELVLEGRALTALAHWQARRRMDEATRAIEAACTRHGLDALITPAALSTAPDPSTTGDAAFNSPWSYTHLPTVSFPIGLADDGLPVAIQLAGPLERDFELLQTARWCEQMIHNHAQ